MNLAETKKPVEMIGSLIMSGHCSFPVTADPQSSHDRCAANGGGSRANPKKTFTPCPCPCHYGEEYECGGCGRPIKEALLWPFDEDGDMRYTHIDKDGRATGEDCASVKVSRNPERSEVDPVEDEPESYPDEVLADEPVAYHRVLEDADPEDEFEALLAEFDLDD